MQLFSFFALISTVAALTVRQAAPPQCAFGCLTNTNPHGCSMTDNDCLCHNAAFVADQSACIKQACTNAEDLQQADTFAQQNCLLVGVTLTASNPGTPTDTSAGSSASATSPPATAPPASNAAFTTGISPVVILASVAFVALAL